jgi:hypothetical protein
MGIGEVNLIIKKSQKWYFKVSENFGANYLDS